MDAPQQASPPSDLCLEPSLCVDGVLLQANEHHACGNSDCGSGRHDRAQASAVVDRPLVGIALVMFGIAVQQTAPTGVVNGTVATGSGVGGEDREGVTLQPRVGGRLATNLRPPEVGAAAASATAAAAVREQP